MRTAGHVGVIAAVGVLLGFLPGVATGQTRDTMQLTDEPGNWFRSEASGTPVSTVRTGGRVDSWPASSRTRVTRRRW
jgi:hypothetical protein